MSRPSSGCSIRRDYCRWGCSELSPDGRSSRLKRQLPRLKNDSPCRLWRRLRTHSAGRARSATEFSSCAGSCSQKAGTICFSCAGRGVGAPGSMLMSSSIPMICLQLLATRRPHRSAACVLEYGGPTYDCTAARSRPSASAPSAGPIATSAAQYRLRPMLLSPRTCIGTS